MNIFREAAKQIAKENKLHSPNALLLVLKRAEKIRKVLDILDELKNKEAQNEEKRIFGKNTAFEGN